MGFGMRIAFLIIAHSEPEALRRLVLRLLPSATKIFVHLNQKSDISLFGSAAESGCTIVKNRIPVTWGTCSLWEAVVSTAEEALQSGGVDRLVLLSQSCYPLVSPPVIQDFFSQEHSAEFIGSKPLLSQSTGRWRLKFNMLQTDLPRWINAKPVGGIVRRLAVAKPALNWKSAMKNRIPHSGCLWWALTTEAAAHVVETYRGDTELRSYAQYVFGPEEILPHTILANSKFATQIRHHVTYESWPRHSPHPRWLHIEDARRVTSPSFVWRDRYGTGTPLFARKFGGESGEAAKNWLDKMVSAKGM